jgi:hypothetical protein
MTDLSQSMYILAAAVTGIVYSVLSYLCQRQGRDMLAAALAAAAILFSVLCIGLVIWR